MVITTYSFQHQGFALYIYCQHSDQPIFPEFFQKLKGTWLPKKIIIGYLVTFFVEIDLIHTMFFLRGTMITLMVGNYMVIITNFVYKIL